MNRAMDRELMRLLHGELPDEQARGLRERLEREPELAAAWARLERSWNGLELPPAAPAPPAFSQSVLARARRQSRQSGTSLSWGVAPAWVRASAAAALAAGLALGIGAGLGVDGVEGGRNATGNRIESRAEVGSPGDDTENRAGNRAENSAESSGENRVEAHPPVTDEPLAISASEADAEPSLAEAYWDSLEDLEGSSSTTDGERL
jgi:hypothetical protein